jgi:hypothetical protein
MLALRFVRALSTPPPPPRFLVLISVGGWVNQRAIVRLEGLGKFKKNNDLIGIDPATFWLIAYCPNQLCYHLHRHPAKMHSGLYISHTSEMAFFATLILQWSYYLFIRDPNILLQDFKTYAATDSI